MARSAIEATRHSALQLASLVDALAYHGRLVGCAEGAHAALAACAVDVPGLTFPCSRLRAAHAVGPDALAATVSTVIGQYADRPHELLAIAREVATRPRRDDRDGQLAQDPPRAAMTATALRLVETAATSLGPGPTALQRFDLLVELGAEPARIDASGREAVAAIAGRLDELNSFAWRLLRDPEHLEMTRTVALHAAEAMTRVPGWDRPDRLDTLALARFENGDVESAVALQERAVELLGEKAGAAYVERLERYRAARAAAPSQAAPYASDPEHPANRIFRAIYRVELVPATVSAALPGEHGDEDDFYVPGWYFRSREGTAADRRVYGGDGRQMPREGFRGEEAEALRADLAALDGDLLARLRGEPRLAVYLQHDLLRLARRLLETKANPDLLPELRAAAMRLALPAAALRDPALSTFAKEQLAPHLIDVAPEALVEIDRRSTRLFDAEFTQLWSSLWIAVPGEREFTTATLLEAAASADKATVPEVPLGTTAAMALGIVAVDDEGIPRATDLVIDVRVQHFANRDDLGADNPTTTRDGVDFLQWLLPRQRVRELAGEAIGLDAFRSVPMDSAEVFRDYGTLKHTTYAAQCSLCHRRTDTPDAALAGFSALRASAKPRRVASPDARKRLAEEEMARFLEQFE